MSEQLQPRHEATDEADAAALRTRLRRLANEEFPAVARSAPGYPIYLNHCFLRVVYDNLFDRPWREVLRGKEPAVQQLDARQLREAVALGEAIRDDPALCRDLNARSLELRGKVGPRRAKT